MRVVHISFITNELDAQPYQTPITLYYISTIVECKANTDCQESLYTAGDQLSKLTPLA